ncbi:acetyl-CoA synthetase-like protein, partial [Pleurotus eryngii]
NLSSGTTGKPKAVAIPHFLLIANVIQLAVHNRINEAYTTWEERRFRPGDVCIGVLPFYHIYGLVINLHFILFASMSIVVIPRFNFVGMLNSTAKHRITHLMLVPPQVVLLCKHPVMATADVSSVRFIMVGAAPLTYEVTEQLIRVFPNAHIGQAYGMTETCTATTMWPIERKRGAFGSGGQLLPGIVARVEKQDGTPAGFDEPGHLVIKTPSVALGYAENEEASKETFVDGWVRTGDEVRIDSNKEVWVLDRLKEIMKVRGFQVAPAELEGCLLDHPDVSDACVVGIPDDFSGEVPMAFVVPAPYSAKRMQNDKKVAGKIKTSIIQHVADNKVKYKHLAGGVEFIDIIPKNPSGKLLRRVLRDKARHLQKSRTMAKL